MDVCKYEFLTVFGKIYFFPIFPIFFHILINIEILLYVMSEDLGKGIRESLKEARIFEDKTRKYFGSKFKTNFEEKEIIVGKTKKKFDLVSEDNQWVGDVKYYKNIQTPSAKFSTIAEYVWLLEKVKAKNKFIVFGNDREVPERWLLRFGSLVKEVKFYYFDGKSLLELN